MVQENILSLDKSSSAIAVMLPFSSASSAADLAMKHCNLKKNKHSSKYVVTNFTHNNMEYIIARKTSISPSHGGL